MADFAGELGEKLELGFLLMVEEEGEGWGFI